MRKMEMSSVYMSTFTRTNFQLLLRTGDTPFGRMRDNLNDCVSNAKANIVILL